ncbi:hypothetical protein V490_09082, partial [Pseudogymnoascus sp. VKM F-3557]
MKELNYEATKYLYDIPLQLWTAYFYPWPRYGHDTSNIAESLNSSWRDIRTLQPLKMMDAIWSTVMKTVHDRKIRPQKGFLIADIPWAKFQERLQKSQRYRVFESGNGIYQVQIPDTGLKFTVNLTAGICTCPNFWEYQAPCSHAICAARHDQIDPTTLFNIGYFLSTYRNTYSHQMLPIEVTNLTPDPSILPPRLVKLR